jgi:rod shape-determining protein MreD
MKRGLLDALLTTFAVRSARRPEAVDLSAGSGVIAVRGYQPKALLRPVNPGFIWLTLFVALAANLLPWGRSPLVPDFLALALVFWNVQQPRRVGMGAAFVFGLLMDVHNGALFGEHALAYTLLSYGAISLHRRILWFPLGAQAVHVLPLLVIAQLASLLIRMWVGGTFPGWSYFVESAVGAVLWPAVSWLLLAPQRRPIERDETRPL